MTDPRLPAVNLPVPSSAEPGTADGSPHSPARRQALAVAGAAGLVLTGCATPGPAAEEFVQPNANLVVQGVPPIPRSLVRDLERYSDFRGHALVDWHPLQREMLVSHRAQGASTAQLFRVGAPGGALVPLTRDSEPIGNASYEPREGRYVVFMRSVGGNEAYQLWRQDLGSANPPVRLTDPDKRHAMVGWLRSSGRLLVASVPLDRTAAGGTRATVNTAVTSIDPLDPAQPRTVAELPGPGWFASDINPQDTHALFIRYVSATDSELWELELATGQRRRLLPREGAPRAFHGQAQYRRAGGPGLLAVTDMAGEFRELVAYAPDGTQPQRITANIPWDVTDLDQSTDGLTVSAQINEDGSDGLHLFDGRTLQTRPRPALPPGNVQAARFHPTRGELAFSLNSPQSPGQIFGLDLASGRTEPWTQPASAPGIDTGQFQPQRLIRWTSFDGRTISGWLAQPPARHRGPRPVLIEIHGGPEAQAQAGFLGRWQYVVQEMGVVHIRPNVRGSSGYGKTFLNLDNGRLREDSVKDIGALLDWIAKQPGLDASRVVVTGGSYGGYMSLASAVHFGDRLAGAIDIVGISHFVTFLESTESYRRDLRRVEYGDERDPAMRAFLNSISPLTNAHRIRKPLFVIQGRNDPRVPWTEAEQIVQRARSNGTPVWYLLAENEGHGFARKENADFLLQSVVMFLRQTMRLS